MSDDARFAGRLSTEDDHPSRPKPVWFLIATLAFQGVSGLAGGLGLVADPSGALIGLPREWLTGSPFGDYMIPGVVLLTFLGIAPLAVAYGVWVRRTWSWMGSLVVAAALLVWLGVEVAVIGYHAQPPLQLVYGIVGLLILGGALAPAVRAHLVDDALGS